MTTAMPAVAGGSSGWTVTGTVPRVSVVSGNPVEGHQISFVTNLGNRSDVFVPNTVTNLDRVRAMIADRAEFIDGVSSLQG